MLIERDDELAAIQVIARSIEAGGGRLVTIFGEAGIGKTSLIAEFAKREHTTAIGLCDPLETPAPLGPVREIHRQIVGPDANPSGEVDYFHAFVERLERRSAPQILCVEDAHWADRRTIDWIAFVGRRVAALPILLIVTYRDDEIDADHPLQKALGVVTGERKARLPLASLSVDGVRRLGVPSGRTAEDLHRVSGGNPFFCRELIDAPEASRVVPASVLEAVDARAGRMDADLRAFLEHASCAPGLLRSEELRETFEENHEALLDEAVRRRVLAPREGGYRFRHELVRMAMAQRLGPEARKAAHGVHLRARLARARPEDDLDEIVHHARGAGDGDAVLAHAPRAAARAAAFGAHREAAAHLAAALDFVDRAPPEAQARLLEDWAYEAGIALEVDDDVIAARERALALWRELERPDKVGDNLRHLSRLHWYRGESAKARSYVDEAIDVLKNEPHSSAKAWASALSSQFDMLNDRMEDAARHGRAAIELAKAADDAEVEAHALNTVGSAAMFRGDAGGEAMLRQSLALSKARGFHEQAARVYTNLSECLIEAGRLDDADRLLDEGLAFDLAHELDAWTYYLVGRQAHLRFEQGRLREAIDIAESVLARDGQTVLMRMPSKVVRARASIRAGASDGEAVLRDAERDARAIGEPQYLFALAIARAEFRVLSGARSPEDGGGALGVAGEAAPSSAKLAEWAFWTRRLGERDDGVEASLGDDAFRLDSEGAHARAADAFLGANRPYFAAWCLIELATTEAYARADALWAEQGAGAARKRLREELARRGEKAPLAPFKRGPYGAARRHPYGLTAKEQEVLRHVLEGKSNAAIADAVSRSVRTVENHVSSILAKFGVGGRVDLVLRARADPRLDAR